MADFVMFTDGEFGVGPKRKAGACGGEAWGKVFSVEKNFCHPGVVSLTHNLH